MEKAKEKKVREFLTREEAMKQEVALKLLVIEHGANINPEAKRRILDALPGLMYTSVDHEVEVYNDPKASWWQRLRAHLRTCRSYA